MVVASARWLSFRSDFLSSLFVASMAISSVFLSGNAGKRNCRNDTMKAFFIKLIHKACGCSSYSRLFGTFVTCFKWVLNY